MPIGPYRDFADCVAKNQDKASPEAYCSVIEREAEKAASIYRPRYRLQIVPVEDHETLDYTGTGTRFHLGGKHDQASHGKGGGMVARSGMGDVPITDSMVADMAGGSAAPHLVKNADGRWEFTPERQALHDEIVAKRLAGVPESTEPTARFLGGGSGAGKSTAAANPELGMPAKGKAVTVDADDIKRDIPDYDAMVSAGDSRAAAFSHEESSYLAKRVTAASLETRRDVVIDGTGDSSEASMRGKIKQARDAGYRVEADYVTCSTDEALRRAKVRGERTGRVVPDSVVLGIHAAVSDVLPRIAGDFDRMDLWDTTDGLTRVASATRGSKVKVLNKSAYDGFLSKANP